VPELAHLGRAHVGVAQQGQVAAHAAQGPGKAPPLDLSGALDALAEVGAGFDQPLVGELAVRPAKTSVYSTRGTSMWM